MDKYLKPKLPTDTAFDLRWRNGFIDGLFDRGSLHHLTSLEGEPWALRNYPASGVILRLVKQEGNVLHLENGTEIEIVERPGEVKPRES